MIISVADTFCDWSYEANVKTFLVEFCSRTARRNVYRVNVPICMGDCGAPQSVVAKRPQWKIWRKTIDTRLKTMHFKSNQSIRGRLHVC